MFTQLGLVRSLKCYLLPGQLGIRRFQSKTLMNQLNVLDQFVDMIALANYTCMGVARNLFFREGGSENRQHGWMGESFSQILGVYDGKK